MGAAGGVAVGVMIGLFSLVRAGLVPLVAAIFPIPKIALLPLFVIWFGIDEGSKYALTTNQGKHLPLMFLVSPVCRLLPQVLCSLPLRRPDADERSNVSGLEFD